MTEAEACALYLVDADRKQLRSGPAHGASRTLEVPVGVGIVGATFSYYAVVLVADAATDTRFAPEPDAPAGSAPGALLGVPLRDARQEVIGVPLAVHPTAGNFDALSVELLSALGGMLACVIEGERLREQLARR
jgi:signal transduction protein with GAF and PtsI domain